MFRCVSVCRGWLCFWFCHQAFKDMLYAAQDQAPSIEGKETPCLAYGTPTHTRAHRHTYLWTHCPQLRTCLGIPRITTLYRLKIGGNHCLHAVAQPAGSDSTRKIISFYLTGLSVSEENIRWKKKSKTSVWRKPVTYQNSSIEAAVMKQTVVSLRLLTSPGVAAHHSGDQQEPGYN